MMRKVFICIATCFLLAALSFPTNVLAVDGLSLSTSRQAVLFDDSNAKPGDALERDLWVMNDGSINYYYKSSAEFVSGDEYLWDAIMLEVSKVNPDTEEKFELYKGKIADFVGFEPRFLRSQTMELLHFKLYIDYSLDNSYQGLNVDFLVTLWAEAVSSTDPPTDGPPTNPPPVNPPPVDPPNEPDPEEPENPENPDPEVPEEPPIIDPPDEPEVDPVEPEEPTDPTDPENPEDPETPIVSEPDEPEVGSEVDPPSSGGDGGAIPINNDRGIGPDRVIETTNNGLLPQTGAESLQYLVYIGLGLIIYGAGFYFLHIARRNRRAADLG
ncbi:hypothetical protein FLK61_29700 [Paenalkalicoccus suaedae]|uniref:LPXTG cell wall anchor domain-containing protein n=1 Tax=Paenalkalicoccus suaedae TaxID=2592382 RepID=A0A859FC26_9BACI|nr:hypothetical protein [Paenalkalicoccus suaedae]QKS70903.1 hypothetical protein FLK61_29700 [Paenalkalicoccus suaedae]